MFKSSSFRPQTRGLLSRQTGFSVRGQPSFSDAEEVLLAVIRLDFSTERTSIRTDKSGSQARAEENTIKARFLIEPGVKPRTGDRLSVLGYDIRLVSVFPRLDQLGGLSHYQVDGEIWA